MGDTPVQKLKKMLPTRAAKNSATPKPEETPPTASEETLLANEQGGTSSAAGGKQRLSKAGAGFKAASQEARRRASVVGGSAKDTSANVTQAVKASARRATSGSKQVLDKATDRALGVVGSTQALLASNLSNDLNQLMQDAVDGAPTIYDQAMDAAYNATREGGAQHRLFDGGHTIAGAVSTSHDASADDGIIQEAFGTVLGLLRDGTTPMGFPSLPGMKRPLTEWRQPCNRTLRYPRVGSTTSTPMTPLNSWGERSVRLRWPCTGIARIRKPLPDWQAGWDYPPLQRPTRRSLLSLWLRWPRHSTRPVGPGTTRPLSMARRRVSSVREAHWRQSRSWGCWRAGRGSSAGRAHGWCSCQ